MGWHVDGRGENATDINVHGAGVSVSFWNNVILTKPGAPFVCIEPWLGVADTAGHAGPIEDKQGIHRIAPETSFIAHYCLGIQ